MYRENITCTCTCRKLSFTYYNVLGIYWRSLSLSSLSLYLSLSLSLTHTVASVEWRFQLYVHVLIECLSYMLIDISVWKVCNCMNRLEHYPVTCKSHCIAGNQLSCFFRSITFMWYYILKEVWTMHSYPESFSHVLYTSVLSILITNCGYWRM